MLYLLCLGLIAWWVSGSLAFMYYMLRDFNLPWGGEDYLMCFIVGIMGPSAWIIGHFIHADIKGVFK